MTMDPQRPTQVEEDALRSFNAAIAHLTRNALTAEQAAVDLEAMHDAVEIGMLARRGDVTKDQVPERSFGGLLSVPFGEHGSAASWPHPRNAAAPAASAPGTGTGDVMNV